MTQKKTISKPTAGSGIPQGIDSSASSSLKQPNVPTLDAMLSEFDKNLSRFYNGMNTLDSFADRLKPSDQAQMPIGPAPIPPSHILGRMERLLSDINHLNNRLDATNNYLSEIA